MALKRHTVPKNLARYTFTPPVNCWGLTYLICIKKQKFPYARHICPNNPILFLFLHIQNYMRPLILRFYPTFNIFYFFYIQNLKILPAYWILASGGGGGDVRTAYCAGRQKTTRGSYSPWPAGANLLIVRLSPWPVPVTRSYRSKNLKFHLVFLTFELLSLAKKIEWKKRALILLFVFATMSFLKCSASVRDISLQNWSELANAFIESLKAFSARLHLFA